jgi:predicted RNA-binding Zn ribbon-like protein
MPLLLVQGFVNTRDVDADTDQLAEPAAARRWFVAAGLLADGANLPPGELRQARRARESLRALLVANAGGPPPSPADLAALAAAAQRCRPTVRVGADGAVALDSAPASGLRSGWLLLLLVIRDAQRERTWPRLKVCQNTECGWAFYDRSHSRRGRWCDMAGCGNRMKNRELRARQRGDLANGGPGP